MATVYIAPTAQGSADGTSEANAYAYSSLSTAESDAGSGGTIFFTDGTYTLSGNQTWDGSGINYKSLNLKQAIIDGNSTLRQISIGSATSTNILISDFHFKDTCFIIDGTGTNPVSISGIFLEYTAPFSRAYFGTIYGKGKRLDITNSVFAPNYSAGDSLIYHGNSASEVTNCTFNITATGLAANAIRNFDSYSLPKYKNCIFSFNF